MGDTAQDCTFLTKGGVDLATLPAQWESQSRDPRISAAIVVDAGYS